MVSYTLVKMSEPGFVLHSVHAKVINEILLCYICKECLEEFDSTYAGIDRTYYLLESACGAEFMLEEQHD